MENMLELVNVSKNYDDFSLKNISFSLKRGYIMGFIGANGAGKSTTIKLIMNLIKKDSGDICIFGLNHEKHTIPIKEQIGFVYDENYFYDELTIEEMKNIIRPFYSKWDERTFQTYIQDFHLPNNKPIKQLSKGMKMKFSLAIALSHHAELLIMDEPTSGLDPIVRSELLDILQTVISDGKTSVLFSTHITSDLDKVADFITLIHNGEIIVSKTKDELLEEYCIVRGSKDKLAELTEDIVIGVKENQFGFLALCSHKKEVTEHFGNSVIIEKPTLEDIMIFFTKRRESHVSTH